MNNLSAMLNGLPPAPDGTPIGPYFELNYTYNRENQLTGYQSNYNIPGSSADPCFILQNVQIDGLGRLVSADEILTKVDNSPVSHSLAYTYDRRSELLSASMTNIGGGTWTAGYTYAADGNLQSVTGTQSHTLAYDIDNDQIDDCDLLTKMDSQSISWDDNGNMVAGLNTLSTTWNWDHKLRSASVGSDGISCKYAPDGAMVYKESTVSSTTTKRKYILDTVGSIPKILLAVDPDTSEIKKTYIHADNEVLLQHDGDYNDDRYFYLHDRLGSVRMIIDSEGNVKNHYTFDPFGNPLTSEIEENVMNPYRFANYVWDSTISQYYCINRWVDSQIFRFTSRDPVYGKFEKPLTLHAYLYCMNNPINLVDPTGRYYEQHDTEDTLRIIREATELSGDGFSGPFEAFGRRTKVGKYDFKYHPDWEGDTFELHDVVMDGGDFGNYVAGYAGVYNYGTRGEIGTRGYGHLYSLSQYHQLDDADSKYYLSAGILQAQADRGGAYGLDGLSFVFAKFDLYRGIERICMMDMYDKPTSFMNYAKEIKTSTYEKELNTFLQFWNSGRLAH